MAKIKILTNVSTRQIEQAINTLKWYESRLQYKCEQVVKELADIGIEVIQDNVFVEYDGEVRNFGDSVFFRKEITTEVDGATCELFVNAEPYLKEWTTGSALVDPLLMAEFGSGAKAIDGHRGEFPNQKHAFEGSWFWRDMSGRAHVSSGNTPSRPMFKAVQEMRQQIHTVAIKVFNE